MMRKKSGEMRRQAVKYFVSFEEGRSIEVIGGMRGSRGREESGSRVIRRKEEGVKELVGGRHEGKMREGERGSEGVRREEGRVRELGKGRKRE